MRTPSLLKSNVMERTGLAAVCTIDAKVLKGRLNLAQDVVLGRVRRLSLVPSGTAEIVVDSVDG
jgi:hypothetical protein